MSKKEKEKPGYVPYISSMIALMWAFLSATLFFIAVDPWLSGMAITRSKRALGSWIWAIVGTFAGGTVLYFWSTWFVQDAVQLMPHIPGIDTIAFDTAIDYLDNNIWSIPLLSMFFWTPAKIYFSAAGCINYPYFSTLLMTLPILAIRFGVVMLVFSWLNRTVWKEWTTGFKGCVIGGFWIVFYLLYFGVRYLGSL